MTYLTGTATDFIDLIGQLNTFATVTHGGWAAGYSPAVNVTDGWWELSKGTTSVSMKFTVGAQAPVDDVSIHHATGFSVGLAPGRHVDDSGNGFNAGATGHTNADLSSERNIHNLGNGPYTFHFFADDTSPNDYIHCVVLSDNGYRHFGWGDNLVHDDNENFGSNWVGGGYVYGHYQVAGTARTAIDDRHSTLLDGLNADFLQGMSATLRITSGLANQGVATWANVTTAAATGGDTAGKIRQRVHGGFRSGMEARGFGTMKGSISTGWIPSYGISANYRDPSNARVYLLGYMADVRALNIANFTAEQEVQIGTEVWILFPMSIKTTDAVDFRSLNSGIMYRKVI